MNTHRKGSAWRREVELLLVRAGFTTVVRGLGFAGDDILASRPGLTLSVEAKNHRALDLAEWIDQAEGNAPDHAVAVVVAHRRGRAEPEDGYVVMSGRAFTRLVRGLG